MLPALTVALIALALIALVARPLVRAAPADAGAADEDAVELESRVAGALSEIEEIEFDRASGHLSEADFTELSADAKRRAVELIRAREADD